MSDEVVAAFAALDSSSISDALDRLGIAGQPLGIRPLLPSFRLCGRAFTVRYRPVDQAEPGTVGDFIDDVSPDDVVVIDNGGRLDATVWGDLMTTVASRNRVGGTVIDGVSRDSSRAVELGYPIFARSTFMRTGKDRVQMDAIQETVLVANHPVSPGDVVFGDADGVVVVPVGREREVLEAATEIERAEQAIRELLAGGERLDTARRRQHYHRLQSRRT